MIAYLLAALIIVLFGCALEARKAKLAKNRRRNRA